MSTFVNNNGKRVRAIFSLGAAVIGALLIVNLFFALVLYNKGRAVQADASFSFTAAGDYGQTSNTTANLTYIAHSGISFDLGLGDFNYSSSVTTAAWSSYAKNILGANFPFEIVSGDHDTSQITALAADLPNQMANMSGTYARNYSFDYPASGPLARFILISPVVLPGSFSKGGANYNWVAKKITGARAAHIPWVIVAMAEGCMYIQSSSNAGTCATPDLLNLLVSEKVDVILQAHQHNYEASKQLALNSQCTSISTTSYNASCVANAGANMTKGAGTTIVTTGTGGESLVNIDTSDPKISYFRKWMGSNVNPTYGVSRFTLSASNLSMQFAAVTGSFTDSFSISGSGSVPGPNPSPSSSPSPTIPSPGPSPAPGITPYTISGSVYACPTTQCFPSSNACVSLYNVANSTVVTASSVASPNFNFTQVQVANFVLVAYTGNSCSGSGPNCYQATVSGGMPSVPGGNVQVNLSMKPC